jgi:hypothetical protein
MATSTFFKTITIGKEAGEIMARELSKPRKPYVPTHDIQKMFERTDELLKSKASHSKKS